MEFKCTDGLCIDDELGTTLLGNLYHCNGGYECPDLSDETYDCQSDSKYEEIGDVANWKRHQRLDEILMFFFFYPTLHRRNQQSSFQKNSVMQYAHETQSCLRSIRLL